MTAPPSIKVNLMHTKSQIDINETLLVLFVIIIIIILGMLVYFRYSQAHITTIAAELSEQESSIILASILRLPEISCTDNTCIDTSKLLPFQILLQGKMSYYRVLFGSKTIRITHLYPEPNITAPCTIQTYNQFTYPDTCNSWVVYDGTPSQFTRKSVISTPISLFFPEQDQYRIGRLEVTTYA